MLKKFTSLFLFISIFSAQALQLPKFSNFNDLTQELYDQNITLFSQVPHLTKFLPKKPITNELAQIHFITLINAIIGRSMLGTIAFAFYDTIQAIELIKQSFEKTKNGYLIAIDINKIEQDIKDIFNITKPTIIYYYNCDEIARSINFDCDNILQHIKNNPFEQNVEIFRFTDLKNLMQEAFYQYMSIFAKIPSIKLISKKPITHELIQVRLLILLGAIMERSKLNITAVAFYNTQKIEQLKKLIKKQKSIYFIAADINKIEPEIKNIFNLTTEPIIIYYNHGKEIARNANFDTNDFLSNIATKFKC